MTRTLDRFWWSRSVAGTLVMSLVLLLATGAVDGLGSATDRRIAITFFIYLMVALGIQTFATSGIISFGHVSFMAIGAYTAAILTTPVQVKAQSVPDSPAFLLHAHLGFVEATAIGVAVTMLLALLVGFPIVRLSGAAAAVATLGLLIITYTVLSNYETVTRGAKVFYGIPPYTGLYTGLAFSVPAILVARLLRDSDVGICLRASRGDELAARSSGVEVAGVRLVAWVLSAGLCALGGSLYAHYVLAISPNAFYFGVTFITLTIVIIGGSTISGVVVSAGLVNVMVELLRRAENGLTIGPLTLAQAPGLSTIAVAALVLLTMLIRPKGLLGRWEVDEWLMRLFTARRSLHRTADAPRTGGVPSEIGGPGFRRTDHAHDDARSSPETVGSSGELPGQPSGSDVGNVGKS